MKALSAIAAVFLLVGSVNSYSEEVTSGTPLTGWYIGAHVDDMTSKVTCESFSCFPYDVNTVTYRLSVGYEFSQYLGLELTYGLPSSAVATIPDEIYDNYEVSYTRQLRQIKEETDYFYRLLLKPMYPVNETFSVFGQFGYSKYAFNNSYAYDDFEDGSLSRQVVLTSDTIHTEDLTYGAGLSYRANDRVSVSVDYLATDNKTQRNAFYDNAQKQKREHISLGAQYRF